MPMKTVSLAQIRPGFILGEAVFNTKGKILLAANSVLTERSIGLLNSWGIQEVSVNVEQDTIIEESPPADNIPVISPEREKFLGCYNVTVTHIHHYFQSIRLEKKVPVEAIQQTAQEVFQTIQETNRTVVPLYINDIPSVEPIAHHCAMVSFLSGMIARWMGLGTEEIKILTFAGMVHDIGKIFLPPALLLKKDRLIPAENDLLRTHVPRGYALMKEAPGIPEEVLLCILEHHENMDGTGYPIGISGKEIHPYARIVSIADTFQNEAYNGPETNPFPVIERLSQEMFGKKDPSVAHTFIQQMRDSLISNSVILSDGRIADIVYFHPNNSDAPLVKTQDGELIDLSSSRHIRIQRVNSEAIS